MSMVYFEVTLKDRGVIDLTDDIRVIVMGIRDKKTCRIGIEAPKHVRIFRSELVEESDGIRLGNKRMEQEQV